MPKVEIYFKILRDLCYDKIDLRNLEIPLLLFLSVRLFVWYFCYQIIEKTTYFLNSPHE